MTRYSMFERHNPMLRWITLAVAVALLAGPAVADDTIFLSDFTIGSGDLNGKGLNTTPGATWVASPIFNADGSIEAANAGSATLAFAPTAGHVYTLDASFVGMADAAGATNPENDWFALGFANGQSTGSTTNDRFLTGNNVVGSAWMFVRGSTTTIGGNNAFLDGTEDGAAWAAGMNTARGGDMDMRIVLDTSDIWGNWNATWYAKRPTDAGYTKVRDTTPLGTTTINSVGIAKSNTGVAGSVTNFSLTSDEPGTSGIATLPDGYVHRSTIGQAYGPNNINGTSFAPDNVTTVGNQQFVAYYEPDTDDADGYDGHVVIGRRTIGTDTWTLSETSFVSNNITDTHDIIAIAVDGDGIMHMSWGMHANQGGGTNYAKSTASVLTPGSPISFTANLGAGGLTGSETMVTYPEFVKLPDGDLLYFYRNGTSGNGDLRLNRYDTATDTWSVVQQPLIDGFESGDASSTNPYWNTVRVDDEGNLHLSWLFRKSSGGISTNHNLYYAMSEDEGATWLKSDGTAYTGTITQSTSEIVVPIPENYNYVNTTGMTFDENNLPVIASRWAPEAGDGNDQVQQMLSWFDGTDWHVSQITQFAEGAGGAGRRPTVLVNEDGRVLVLIAGSSLGNLVMAHSMDRENWEFLDLGVSGYGLDPTYDIERWERDGIISMLFQPTGSDVVTLELLEFDARSYFADIPEPASLALLGLLAVSLSNRGGLLIAKRRKA
jgi:hypothetical protein